LSALRVGMVGTCFIAGTHVDWFRTDDPHDDRGFRTILCGSQVDGFKQGFRQPLSALPQGDRTHRLDPARD